MTSNTIKFILRDKIYEIHKPDPNETILNYIRLKLKKTGTKEGCAEGGCGACTVVLGELKDNNIVYKAINSLHLTSTKRSMYVRHAIIETKTNLFIVPIFIM